MVTLTLTDDEWNTLCNLLDTHIEELRQEIHDSDRSNYKEMLRQNRENAAADHPQNWNMSRNFNHCSLKN